MNIETGKVSTMCQDGEWLMRTVAEKYQALARCLAALSGSDVSAEQKKSSSYDVWEIDLAGINDIDACGCQLLALFLRSLKQNNVNAQLISVPNTIRSKIHFLGFDREFNLSN